MYGEVFCSAQVDNRTYPTLTISTLEGAMLAKVGDFIIKGIEGEFYPCDLEIFKKTYELVEE